jgi:glutathione S-transferase
LRWAKAHPIGIAQPKRNAAFARARVAARDARESTHPTQGHAMKLYFSTGTCALASHVVLAWIGKPYTLHKLTKEQRKEPAFLKINPAGAVPVIEEDDGWILTQNSAILNYLADKHPEAHLGGEGIRGRAEVNRWIGVVNSDVHPGFKPLFGASAFLEDEALINKAKDHARQHLRTLFERINTHLEGRDWLADMKSVADPYLFVTLRWAKGQSVDLSGFDHLETFFRRMSEDAGVKRALAEQEAA